MRNNRKTEIDFLLTGRETEERVNTMEIDDLGKKWSIGADHSFIVTEVNWSKRTISQKKKSTEANWDINKKANWTKYLQEMRIEIKHWEEEMDELDSEGEDAAEMGYRQLITSINKAAFKSIGKRRNTKKLMNKGHNQKDK